MLELKLNHVSKGGPGLKHQNISSNNPYSVELYKKKKS